MTITGVPPLMPHIKSGKLRALGVSAAQRIPQLPDVPTIIEAGVPGYEVVQWYGLLAPAATPKEIIARLHAEIVKALERPLAFRSAPGVPVPPAPRPPVQRFYNCKIAPRPPGVRGLRGGLGRLPL